MIIDSFRVKGEVKQGKTEGIVRHIVCDGSGDISGWIDKYDGFATLSICELETPVGVGNKPVDKVGHARVVFAFNNTKSIDVVIEWLNKTKEKFQEQEATQ